MCKLSPNDIAMARGRFPDAPENCCADVCYPIYVANKNNATWEEMCEAKNDPNGDKILSPGRQYEHSPLGVRRLSHHRR